MTEHGSATNGGYEKNGKEQMDSRQRRFLGVKVRPQSRKLRGAGQVDIHKSGNDEVVTG